LSESVHFLILLLDWFEVLLYEILHVLL